MAKLTITGHHHESNGIVPGNNLKYASETQAVCILVSSSIVNAMALIYLDKKKAALMNLNPRYIISLFNASPH